MFPMFRYFVATEKMKPGQQHVYRVSSIFNYNSQKWQNVNETSWSIQRIYFLFSLQRWLLLVQNSFSIYFYWILSEAKLKKWIPYKYFAGPDSAKLFSLSLLRRTKHNTMDSFAIKKFSLIKHFRCLVMCLVTMWIRNCLNVSPASISVLTTEATHSLMLTVVTGEFKWSQCLNVNFISPPRCIKLQTLWWKVLPSAVYRII